MFSYIFFFHNTYFVIVFHSLIMPDVRHLPVPMEFKNGRHNESMPNHFKISIMEKEESNDSMDTRDVGKVVDTHESMQEPTVGTPPLSVEESSNGTGDQIEEREISGVSAITIAESGSPTESKINTLLTEQSVDGVGGIVSDQASLGNDEKIDAVEESRPISEGVTHGTDDKLSLTSSASDSAHTVFELEKLNKEMKMMEAALQGAARQAQVCMLSVNLWERHTISCWC